MKKKYIHREAIVSRGDQAKRFFLVLSGRLLVMNSSGNSINKVIYKNEFYGLLECLSMKKWCYTIISERNSELFFISSDIFYKNIFSSKEIKNLATPILKMSRLYT